MFCGLFSVFVSAPDRTVSISFILVVVFVIQCSVLLINHEHLRGVMDSWTWEEILDGKGPWRQAGEYRRSQEELGAAKAERQHYKGPRLARKPERQPPNFL